MSLNVGIDWSPGTARKIYAAACNSWFKPSISTGRKRPGRDSRQFTENSLSNLKAVIQRPPVICCHVPKGDIQEVKFILKLLVTSFSYFMVSFTKALI